MTTTTAARTMPERVKQVEVMHVYLVADVDASVTLGIDVPTFCGLWSAPDTSRGGQLPEHGPAPRAWRLCGNCTRTSAYRRGRR